MSISGEFDDDESALIEVIKSSLEELVEMGLLEIVGIETNGEWRYAATPKGHKFINENRSIRDIEGFSE
jgi:predicted transcriptional regulator